MNENNFSINDYVEVLDEAIEGVVKEIHPNKVIIETQDGFPMEFNPNELVKVNFDEITVSDQDLQNALQQKKVKNKASRRSKKREKNIPPMEVDLHIHHLTNNFKSLSNFDMLNLQLDTAKRQLEFAISKRIQKIVFIHGVGEGVLRTELETMLGRYDNLRFYDADHRQYGIGATEVYIFQS